MRLRNLILVLMETINPRQSKISSVWESSGIKCCINLIKLDYTRSHGYYIILRLVLIFRVRVRERERENMKGRTRASEQTLLLLCVKRYFLVVVDTDNGSEEMVRRWLGVVVVIVIVGFKTVFKFDFSGLLVVRNVSVAVDVGNCWVLVGRRRRCRVFVVELMQFQMFMMILEEAMRGWKGTE